MAGLLFAAPGLLIYGIVVLWPLVQSLQYSFYEWDGITTAVWVGFDNYLSFFTDPVLRSTLGNVLVLIVFFAVLPIALGLLFSRADHDRQAAWHGDLPMDLLPPTGAHERRDRAALQADVCTRRSHQRGSARDRTRRSDQELARRLHVGSSDRGLIGTWLTFGLCMVLFLSARPGIDTQLYDAASIDGAGPVREFFAVTLPGLRKAIAVALALTGHSRPEHFGLIWMTTHGGPGTSTLTPAVALYKAAFVNPDVGQAAAIGVVMAILCLIAVVITRVSEKE